MSVACTPFIRETAAKMPWGLTCMINLAEHLAVLLAVPPVTVVAEAFGARDAREAVEWINAAAARIRAIEATIWIPPPWDGRQRPAEAIGRWLGKGAAQPC